VGETSVPHPGEAGDDVECVYVWVWVGGRGRGEGGQPITEHRPLPVKITNPAYRCIVHVQ